jgi:hypothetical protein
MSVSAPPRPSIRPKEFHFPLGDPEEAPDLAEQAEARCLIVASLDLPVETEIVVNGG